MLDVGGMLGRSADLNRAADRSLAVAVLGAVPAAITGAADWRDLHGETRRMGTAHALVNSAALALNVGSLAMRARGRRGPARLASFSALLATALAAHVGGELSFGLGIRVNRTAWESPPGEFTAVADVGEVDEGFRRVELAGAPVLLARSKAGEVCAIAATCSHLGGPLDEGGRDGDFVICPWHGSRFDLRTGEVIDGPAVFAQPRYEVRERDGAIELRAPTTRPDEPGRSE
jgi:nitrite reductase/ring-hydroxylating ferredoxin subunit